MELVVESIKSEMDVGESVMDVGESEMDVGESVMDVISIMSKFSLLETNNKSQFSIFFNFFKPPFVLLPPPYLLLLDL